MRGPTKRPIKVQYRRLDSPLSSSRADDLQQALSACMDEVVDGSPLSANPASRAREAEDYGTLVLNEYFIDPAFYFGEILRYRPGQALPLVEMTTGGTAYNLRQRQVPPGYEPMKGLLYFMAIGNNVMMIESDITATRAEDYLWWLLRERTRIVSSATELLLTQRIQVRRRHASGVNAITITPMPITPEASPRLIDDDVGGPGETVSTRTRDVDDFNALRVLLAAGLDEIELQKLTEQNRTIEVTLQIKVKGEKGRKQNIGPEETNRLLRHLSEDAFSTDGPGGKEVGGVITRLSYPTNVTCDGELLDPKDVRRALYEAYQDFAAKGLID